jgi:formylglycine-generating enzyme required for sulfatase activity
MNFVNVPAGTFEMGDHFTEGWYDERPVHTVILDSFMISKYETTNAQFAEYLNVALADALIQVVDGVVYDAADSNQAEPYFDTHSISEDSQIEYGPGQFTVRSRDGHHMANHPVVKVSWYGATAFCDYYGYRLPTEAEWEYAARGGFHNPYYRYPWGSDTLDEDRANYYRHNPLGLTTLPCTTPVGRYGPQGTYGDGLCDMAGNAMEWCQDRHGSYGASESPVINPVGSAGEDYRILRGGSWFHRPKFCRTADRNRYAPFHRSRFSGFRVCVPGSAPD